MTGTILSFPYMGILAILLMTMTLEADALTAWDCNRDVLESRTVYLKDLSEGEKALVESMRTLGVQYPDEFAYKFKRVPGYTAIIEEDKIHIIQCEPVVVLPELLLPQDKCYDRLQIVHHNNIFFLTPWTHLITETANEIPCNAPNLRDYELEGSTYKIVPRPGVSLEPRRDKNFEEDPVNSSPKLTPKYKETEYRRRRNIGGIDTVSKESIQSYMYRLEHPELDLEPRRDKNFEEDPENSSPKLTPKYKETEYRGRNIGGIDTVSKESIQSSMYRLEHPELDLEPRRDKNFEERSVMKSRSDSEVWDQHMRDVEQWTIRPIVPEPTRWYNMDFYFFIYLFIGALLSPIILFILLIFLATLFACIKILLCTSAEDKTEYEHINGEESI